MNCSSRGCDPILVRLTVRRRRSGDTRLERTVVKRNPITVRTGRAEQNYQCVFDSDSFEAAPVERDIRNLRRRGTHRQPRESTEPIRLVAHDRQLAARLAGGSRGFRIVGGTVVARRGRIRDPSGRSCGSDDPPALLNPATTPSDDERAGCEERPEQVRTMIRLAQSALKPISGPMLSPNRVRASDFEAHSPS